MGGALHTLEDLLAHSNWIELSLNKMGCRDVFVHVGDAVKVNAPGGQRVAPLVTGT
jgi:Heterokaryon incompatibility protein Het-C